jgi:transcriptional regulator with XRE-family HTH domain
MSLKFPNPIDKHVGSRMRMRREILGLSQEKLATAFGLTFQQVQKYEKGVNRMGASRLQRAAETLHVEVPFFFEGAPGGHELSKTAPAGSSSFKRSKVSGICVRTNLSYSPSEHEDSWGSRLGSASSGRRLGVHPQRRVHLNRNVRWRAQPRYRSVPR